MVNNLFINQEEKSPSPKNFRGPHALDRRTSYSHGELNEHNNNNNNDGDDDLWGKLHKIFFNSPVEETSRPSRNMEHPKYSS